MPDLPASWNLRKQRRSDGKLDIIGKADNGDEYRVRTTDTSEITEKDVQELKAADRESYSNPETSVRDYVKYLTSNPAKEAAEAQFEDELIEAAGPVVHAGLERKGLTVGSSRAYRANYDNVFGKVN